MRGRLILPLLAAWLAGCSSGEPPAPLPPAPQRVICASPAVAEIVFALGADAQVVGVTDFTTWPPAATAKPSIGGALTPNRERILALQPDLILAQGKSETLAALARQHQFALITLPLDSLADLHAAITTFSAALGTEARGAALLHDMESAFDAYAPPDPIPVFIALGHAPGDLAGLMTAGPGTFLHEIVDLAGGLNIFADLSLLWPRISQEALIRRAPALLLDVQATPLPPPRRQALIADWEHLGFHANQVRILEEDYLLRPGPRAAQALTRIAHALQTPPPLEN